MPECVNLFDNKIEDQGEIASEETNEEYKEERKDGANQLISKKSVVWSHFSIKAVDNKVHLCNGINKLICTLYKNYSSETL